MTNPIPDLPRFLVAYSASLSHTFEVKARDVASAVLCAAEGLLGIPQPANRSSIWVFNHQERPARWEEWICFHHISVSISFIGKAKVENNDDKSNIP